MVTLSPRLEKNYTLKRSSKSFPGITSISGCPENCQKYIQKSQCSPIQEVLKCVKTRGRICPIILQEIGYCPMDWKTPGLWNGFLTVFRHPDIHNFQQNCWNSALMHSFFSNPGDNVIISAEVSCSKDLRVGHK